MRTSKYSRLCLLAMAVVVFLVTPSVAQATKPLPPVPLPPDSDDRRRGGWCDVPGILINDSSKTIVIVGDLPGAAYDWQYYWLSPGQVSHRDTNPKLCDTDYFTYQHAKFIVKGQSRSKTVKANNWSEYMFNRTYRCVDHTATWGDTVKCSYERQNWGEQS